MGEEPNHMIDSLVLYKSFNTLYETLYLSRCLQSITKFSEFFLFLYVVYNVKVKKGCFVKCIIMTISKETIS